MGDDKGMTFYVIRHKPTMMFLPAGGKGLRGHTHQEPTDKRPPRLFTTSRDAKKALTFYCDGKWKELSYQSGSDGEWDYDLSPIPNSKRNKDDYEIVEVTLVEWVGTIRAKAYPPTTGQNVHPCNPVGQGSI